MVLDLFARYSAGTVSWHEETTSVHNGRGGMPITVLSDPRCAVVTRVNCFPDRPAAPNCAALTPQKPFPAGRAGAEARPRTNSKASGLRSIWNILIKKAPLLEDSDGEPTH